MKKLQRHVVRSFEELESRQLLTGSVGDMPAIVASSTQAGIQASAAPAADSQPGVVGLTINELSISEGLGSLVVTLLRRGGTDGSVTVDYATESQSAVAAKDFESRAGTLVFAAGESAQQIQIPILDDDHVELTESFTVSLSNPTGGVELGRSTQTISIFDNDALGERLFSDDFESGQRWMINPDLNDSASSGPWEVGSPQETRWSSHLVQPGQAAAGQRALVTGLARVASALSNDVDGGTTSAISPAIQLPAEELAELSFQYFVAHSTGSTAADFLRISIVGTETTSVFERYGDAVQRAGIWQAERIDVSDFAGQSIRILVEANDGDGESIFEAGVDEVAIDLLKETPGILSVARPNYNVDEGAGAVEVELVRSRGRLGEVSIEYRTFDISTDAEDYVPHWRTLTFADGVTTQSVFIDILDDTNEESLEEFGFELRTPSGGAAVGQHAQATIRIVDNDRSVTGYLPDITPVTEGMVAGSYVDTTEQLGRALLRFPTTIANVGTGPLEIWGVPAAGSSQEVFQRIYQEDGSHLDQLAGSFVYHADHGHIHLEGFANFSLRAIDAAGEPGEIVASGGKTSFCLINVAHPFPAITATAGRVDGRGGDECGTTQGISVGHADVYDASLVEQWIDISELVDGDYFLEISADPNDVVRELDERNNVAAVRITVDNPFYTNGEFGTAQPHNPSVFIESAIPLAPGDSERGDIEVAGQADLFRFAATAGNIYEAEVSLLTLGDSVLHLYDVDAETELVMDDDGGSNLGSKIAWVAPEDGIYYWQVKAFGEGTGAYRLRFTEVIDLHGNSPAQASILDLGLHTDGTVDVAGDADWFAFEADADQFYEINAISSSTSGSAVDTHVWLYAADGSTLLESNDNRNSSQSSRLYYRAAVAGTHFIRVSHSDSIGARTGDYRILVEAVEAPIDDFSNSIETADQFPLGVETEARINYERDIDYIQFDVIAGSEYIIDLTLPSSRDGILRLWSNAQHGTVDGEILSRITPIDARSLSIAWTPTVSETVSLELSGVDGDVFRYTIAVTLEEPDSPLAPHVHTTPLHLKAALHNAADIDFFAFHAEAGKHYSLYTSEALDTIVAVYGPDRTTLVGLNDDESAQSVASRVNWTATTSGTHYIVVNSLEPSAFGQYDLHVVSEFTTAVEVAQVDDVPNSLESGRGIMLYSTTSAKLDYEADEDWFRFSASLFRTYNIEAKFAGDTDAVMRLVDRRGKVAAEAFTDGTRTASLDWSAFEAGTSGTYYIQISGTNKVDFQLTLDSDDYGDNVATAELISSETSIEGEIELAGDMDWFRIEPAANALYVIETSLTSLDDSELRVYDANGAELAFNDDGGEGLASAITWAPTSDAPFYLAVGGLGNSTGTYGVSVTMLADDHGNLPAAATELTIDTAISGDIQAPQDKDWFAFPTAANALYRVFTTGGFSISVYNENGLNPIASNGFLGAPISVVAPEDGILYAAVGSDFDQTGEFEIRVQQLDDNHSDSADGGTSLTMGQGIEADLEMGNDRDWFAFDALPDKTYRVDITNPEFGKANVRLVDSEGVQQMAPNGLGFFYQSSSSTPATYYLEVSGTPGPYQLSIGEVAPIAVASLPYEDATPFAESESGRWYRLSTTSDTIYEIANSDVTADTRIFRNNQLANAGVTTTSFVTFQNDDIYVHSTRGNDATPGISIRELAPEVISAPAIQNAISSNPVSDWYRFQPTQGTVYTVDVNTADVTVRLHSALDDIDRGTGAATTWIAASNAPVWIEVLSVGTDSIEYTLGVSAQVALFANWGESLAGTLAQGATDWFQFNVFEGGIYRIETTLGTLRDSTLELFDAASNSLQFDDDGGEDVASRITWTADKAGIFFFQVGGLGAVAGSYTVEVNQIGEPFTPPNRLDLNSDLVFDADDIDALFTGVRNGSDDDRFDIDADGDVDQADIDFYLSPAYANVLPGDTNLDGLVGFPDFLQLGAHFGQPGGWSQGESTGDGLIGFPDFLAISNNFGRTTPPPVTSSDEPAAARIANFTILPTAALAPESLAGTTLQFRHGTQDGEVVAELVLADLANFTAEIPHGLLIASASLVSPSDPFCSYEIDQEILDEQTEIELAILLACA